MHKAITFRAEEVRALGGNAVPIPTEHLDDDLLRRAGLSPSDVERVGVGCKLCRDGRSGSDERQERGELGLHGAEDGDAEEVGG